MLFNPRASVKRSSTLRGKERLAEHTRQRTREFFFSKTAEVMSTIRRKSGQNLIQAMWTLEKKGLFVLPSRAIWMGLSCTSNYCCSSVTLSHHTVVGRVVGKTCKLLLHCAGNLWVINKRFLGRFRCKLIVEICCVIGWIHRWLVGWLKFLLIQLSPINARKEGVVLDLLWSIIT